MALPKLAGISHHSMFLEKGCLRTLKVLRSDPTYLNRQSLPRDSGETMEWGVTGTISDVPESGIQAHKLGR